MLAAQATVANETTLQNSEAHGRARFLHVRFQRGSGSAEEKSLQPCPALGKTAEGDDARQRRFHEKESPAEPPTLRLSVGAVSFQDRGLVVVTAMSNSRPLGKMD